MTLHEIQSAVPGSLWQAILAHLTERDAAITAEKVATGAAIAERDEAREALKRHQGLVDQIVSMAEAAVPKDSELWKLVMAAKQHTDPRRIAALEAQKAAIEEELAKIGK